MRASPNLPRFVFGPLPTRRLGRSLGIDTVPPKTCNWNCDYCQLGRTHPLTNERKDYQPVGAILDEVRARLAALPPEAIDWITFVASGESTLHRGIGRLIREVKRLSDRPVAVITNGSLLHLSAVRAALAVADAVLPTLDAGDAETFCKINRPHRGLTFERQVAGIEAFARMKRRGQLWIEVMLLAGLNDSDEALSRLAKVLTRIGPDEIHLTLPTRCPVEEWVRPPAIERIRRAEEILGAQAKLALPPPCSARVLRGAAAAEEFVSVVTRHPLSRADLARLLPAWPAARVERLLKRLLAAGRIQLEQRQRATFIVAASLRYPVPVAKESRRRGKQALAPSRYTALAQLHGLRTPPVGRSREA
ncbi:MAG: radical SAM protein [Opitutaceae bacterium]|nr:radical SAM protein [Opitutaceae bacterium]